MGKESKVCTVKLMDEQGGGEVGVWVYEGTRGWSTRQLRLE